MKIRMVGRVLLGLLWMAACIAPVHAGTKHYYYTDAQGTVLAKADAQGNIVASYDYAPYGAQVLGTPPSGPAGYTGHVNDLESGFVYMQARYYDPGVGRFLSVDPAGTKADDIFGFGRYEYANNNPNRFIDPDGREVKATYDLRTGVLTVRDLDNGHQVFVNAESGGKPFGEPIELGSYDILDHPDSDYLRLEPIDSSYGDDKSKTGRTEFRLHRPGMTWGCIAVCTSKEWTKIRSLIRSTSTTKRVVNSKSRNPFTKKIEEIKRFGELKVIRSPEEPPKPPVSPEPKEDKNEKPLQ